VLGMHPGNRSLEELARMKRAQYVAMPLLLSALGFLAVESDTKTSTRSCDGRTQPSTGTSERDSVSVAELLSVLAHSAAEGGDTILIDTAKRVDVPHVMSFVSAQGLEFADEMHDWVGHLSRDSLAAQLRARRGTGYESLVYLGFKYRLVKGPFYPDGWCWIKQGDSAEVGGAYDLGFDREEGALRLRTVWKWELPPD